MLQKVEKFEEKVFTKKRISNTIKGIYNPFEVNLKIYRKRSEVSMKNIVLKEMRKKLNMKEKIISFILPKTFVRAYKEGIEKGFNARL